MMYRFVVIEGKVKGQIFGSTGITQVKMIQFCWQCSQNVHLVNTMKNKNSLPYVKCFITMVTQQKWTLTFSLHNHVTETCYTSYSEFELYLPDKHFETIASKIGSFLPV